MPAKRSAAITALEQNRSMIFNPLIVVASQLGIGRGAPRASAGDGPPVVRAFRRVAESGIGSVIVDSVDDAEASAAQAAGAYTIRTNLSDVSRTHNYRSMSGAERIAATVNRFDRFYTHDIVVAVPDDPPEFPPFYLQALMYALASTEVGVATLVAPLKDAERADRNVAKASVRWNADRCVHPLEGSRVGTLVDISRDADRLCGGCTCRLVPIHAWRRSALDRLVNMPPSEREFDEGTDLVRAIDAKIRVDVTLVREDMKVLLKPQDLRGDELEG